MDQRRNHSTIRVSLGVVLFLFTLLLNLVCHAYDVTLKTDTKVQVYFSPRGGAQEAIVKAIESAKESIIVQAYSFTSAPIAEALLLAHKRGVKVQAVLDKSQRTEKYSGATFLANAGIPVLIDDAHAIAHNKVIVLDERIVVTGSFNFTKAAEERNAENVIILDSPDMAKLYTRNGEAHMRHSVPYKGN